MFYGRGKNKIQNPYTLPNFYQDFVKDKEGTPYNISYKDYKYITEAYLKFIVQRILDGHKIRLPGLMGNFQITKKPMNAKSRLEYKKRLDWVQTQKLGKQVYHINNHSDNYDFFFTWDRTTNNTVKNIKQYRFIPTRTIKRTMAALIKQGRDYFGE